MDRRFFVAEENYKRLDVFLSERMEEFTRSRIKKLIDEGHVLSLIHISEPTRP